MREGFRTDVTGAHPLKAIVADGGSGSKPGFNIARIEEIALFGGVAPDSSEAVGLELDADGKPVGG